MCTMNIAHGCWDGILTWVEAWTKRFLFPGIQYSQLMDGGTEILFVFLGELNKMKVNKWLEI